VRALLASNPSLVHARGGDGQLPLHFAATVEIATILLDAGADIDARDFDHESTAAQYMASVQPHRHEVARFLVSRGAKTDILMGSAIGDLAGVERILNDDPDTVRMTVHDRYFPKQDPKSGGVIYFFGFGWTKSPHMLAHQFEHPEVFALLMQRSAPWLRLLNAAEIGDEAYFRRILADHPRVLETLSAFAARRLLGVAIRNNTSCLHLLLDAGWPANAVMETGQTALHFAAWHGNIAMVRDLIAHNASVNVFETEHGGNSLSWTLHGSLNSWHRSQGDYPAVARALLAAGAQIPHTEKPLEAEEEVLEVIRQFQPGI
jgi:ankyrin repeat protein